MAGPLVAALALFAVVALAYLSQRQRRMAKPDPNLGAAIVVRQLRADYETYAPSERESGNSGLNAS
jgi:hypothetical protein